MNFSEAEVSVGGSTYRCKARLDRWKEHVEADSFEGPEARHGLPDWEGTIRVEGDTDSAIETTAWAIQEAEDAKLRIGDFEGSFGVVDGDVGSGVLQIRGHGPLMHVH